MHRLKQAALIGLAAIGILLCHMQYGALERALDFYRTAKAEEVTVIRVSTKLDPQSCGVECSNKWDAAVEIGFLADRQSRNASTTFSGNKEDMLRKLQLLQALEGRKARLYISSTTPDNFGTESPSYPWGNLLGILMTAICLVAPALLAFFECS